MASSGEGASVLSTRPSADRNDSVSLLRSVSSSSASSFSSPETVVLLAVEPSHLVGMAPLCLSREALRFVSCVGEQFLGLAAGGVHEDRRLLLRLPHGEIGGALGEHEGAADAVVVLLRGPFGGRPLGALGPVGELAALLLQLLDRDGHLLEELVYLIGVVTPQAGTKLNLSQEFCSQIHARMVSVVQEKMVDAAFVCLQQPAHDQDHDPHDDRREIDRRRRPRAAAARCGARVASTGSVIASKNRATGSSAEPVDTGM